MSHYLENSDCECAMGFAGRRCTRIVLAVLGALFTFVVGLIVGSFIAAAVQEALPSVIVLAVVLLVLAAIAVFYLLCRSCRRSRCD